MRTLNFFYSNLYKSSFSKVDRDIFLDKIRGFKKVMDDDFKQLMEDELRTEELDRAIKLMAIRESHPE